MVIRVKLKYSNDALQWINGIKDTVSDGCNLKIKDQDGALKTARKNGLDLIGWCDNDEPCVCELLKNL